ncbi:MAG: DUF5684 domain-containing protein [Oscillospiraceae bacterium]|jgi:hypothetical protein|nr:DUF5684 domain-containing protein [Oscillospiraceae bacterium]
MYDYGYEAAGVAGLFGFLAAYWFLALGAYALSVIARWKYFQKAGEEGWAALIPFYRDYVLFKISWGNGWYFFLTWIPFAGFVFLIIAYVKLAKAFGKSGGFACGLIFLTLIFECILAFSQDIKYIGPDGVAPAAPGGYGGGGYQDPYGRSYGYGAQPNSYGQQPGAYNQQSYGQQPYGQQQYTQGSNSNSAYHYQRSEPVSNAGSFCPQCGTTVQPGTKFCPKCGRTL